MTRRRGLQSLFIVSISAAAAGLVAILEVTQPAAFAVDRAPCLALTARFYCAALSQAPWGLLLRAALSGLLAALAAGLLMALGHRGTAEVAQRRGPGPRDTLNLAVGPVGDSEHSGRMLTAAEPALLLSFVFLCSTVFINAPGTVDVSAWVDIMRMLNSDGLVQGYANYKSDIAHGAAVFLWLIVKIGVSDQGSLLILKTMLVVSATVSVYVFYIWTRSGLFGLALFFIIIFNLALGYLDTLYLPSLLLSLRRMQDGHYRSAALLYAFTCIIKWQALIVAPIFFLFVVLPDFRAGLRHLAPAIAFVVITILPFGIEPVLALWRALTEDTEDYVSGYALNVLWLVTAIKEIPNMSGQDLPRNIIEVLLGATADWKLMAGSKLLLTTFYGLLLWQYVRSQTDFIKTLAFATAGFLTYFAFNTSVHENHLYIACILSLLLGYFVPGLQFLAGMLAALNAVNLILFYGLSGSGLGFSRVYGIDISAPFAILVVLLWGCYWWIAVTWRSVAGAEPRVEKA